MRIIVLLVAMTRAAKHGDVNLARIMHRAGLFAYRRTRHGKTIPGNFELERNGLLFIPPLHGRFQPNVLSYRDSVK